MASPGGGALACWQRSSAGADISQPMVCAGGMKKHEINWKVDFARPHNPQLLSKRMKGIAEEALERCARCRKPVPRIEQH